MEAQNDLGPRRMFDSEALGADGNTSVGTHFERCADAPNIGPPRAAWGWAQDGSFFFPGQVPSFLRGSIQFAMDFVDVVMEAQGVDVGVGGFEFGDLLAGEIGGQPALPELVFALDFAFGLRRWGIKETNVVKLESPTELGQRLRVLGEKNAVIIHVELQGSSISQKGGWQKIEIRQEKFPVVKFGADKQAAAIVQHIEHGKIERAGREPIVQ